MLLYVHAFYMMKETGGATMRSSVRLGYLYLSLAASIWGGMYVVSKWTLEVIPPFTLVWLRYVIAFIVLLAFLRRERTPSLTGKDHLSLAGIGFIGYFISISAQFVGTWLSSAHMGALITSATPAFMLLLAYGLLKETLTLKKWASVLLATLGVVVVVGWDIPSELSFLGNMILVVAAVTWAILSVGAKKLGERFSPLLITTYAVGYALLFTTPVMVWEAGYRGMDWSVLTGGPILMAVLYLGVVSTAVAFFLWNQGLKMVEASIGAMFFFFQPVVGSLLGWLWLGEHLSTSFFVGGVLILSGVALSTWKGKPRTVNTVGEPL
jgi:drug/metabolite transporter (DMT)-like permease